MKKIIIAVIVCMLVFYSLYLNTVKNTMIVSTLQEAIRDTTLVDSTDMYNKKFLDDTLYIPRHLADSLRNLRHRRTDIKVLLLRK